MDKNYTIAQVKRSVEVKGYQWLDDKKPYLLNLIGIRAESKVPNSFDDYFCVSYFDEQKWVFVKYRCTTDPGTYWLKNPSQVKGTAILKPGQYLNSWRLGLHQQKYRALVQCSPVTVIRDGNKDEVLNFDGKVFDTGLFGINIHRANEVRESVQVDKWSAGCQVIAHPGSFKTVIDLAVESERLGRKFFSYTLLEEKDILVA